MSDASSAEEHKPKKEGVKKSFIGTGGVILICVVIAFFAWGLPAIKKHNGSSKSKDKTEIVRSHNVAVSEVVEVTRDWTTLVRLPHDLHLTAKESSIDCTKPVEIRMTRTNGTVVQWVEYPGTISGHSIAPGALLEARTIESDLATVYVVCK